MSLLLLFLPSPPAPAPTPTIAPSGGVPAPAHVYLRPLQAPQRLQDADVPRETKKAIQDVAAQQAELLRLDAIQREQMLREEMRLRRLEYRAEHLALLNAERERLITLEIGRLMRARLQADQDTLTLLLIASTV